MISDPDIQAIERGRPNKDKQHMSVLLLKQIVTTMASFILHSSYFTNIQRSKGP
ncbi:LOW QUALITY PROTEIN: hypothetical protein PanWU01x14_250630 [Parasponia andersonii]|uniref:Uncharacterized protein n=1 Tax=Parasponia andersonii TaxID=3476 RepID=A0A2P5BCP3_PARAD|nr:LOW QUALITY PROTEIN: hypothetical protein PanWU01x14_250630 [Parasponia andersonii]